MRSTAAILNLLPSLLLFLNPTLSAAADPPRWNPPLHSTWDINIDGNTAPLPDSYISAAKADVIDIDLFLNNKAVVDKLHARGKKVICYFSAGSYENWRADKESFAKDDYASALVGWEGENWLDITKPNVHKIMQKRLDMAKEMGCDGVDPDNMDGYGENGGGIGLTREKTITYIKQLAGWAHQRGMSCGLKNSLEVVNETVRDVDFQVNEECITKSSAKYYECLDLKPFLELDKPVFHIEYPKSQESPGIPSTSLINSTKDKLCGSSTTRGFNSILKDRDLTAWSYPCWNDPKFPWVDPKVNPPVVPTSANVVVPDEEESAVGQGEEESEVVPGKEEPEVVPGKEEPEVGQGEEQSKVEPIEEEPEVEPVEEEPEPEYEEEDPEPESDEEESEEGAAAAKPERKFGKPWSVAGRVWVA